eukprot:Opistho-2@25891
MWPAGGRHKYRALTSAENLDFANDITNVVLAKKDGGVRNIVSSVGSNSRSNASSSSRPRVVAIDSLSDDDEVLFGDDEAKLFDRNNDAPLRLSEGLGDDAEDDIAFDNPERVHRLVRKVTWRLLPFLMLLYVAAFLDRANLSNAKATMSTNLHLTSTDYGIAASFFFVSYIIFEVPSNMMLERLPARAWIARIIISWGVIATLTMFVKNRASLMAVRFFLGMAEAGFFPGVVFYLTRWFSPKERGHRMAVFYSAQPIAGVLGGFLAFFILPMEGIRGLHGWQWLFMLEGLPTVLLGLITLCVLPETPKEARWLTPAERRFLLRRARMFKCEASIVHGGVNAMDDDDDEAEQLELTDLDHEGRSTGKKAPTDPSWAGAWQRAKVCLRDPLTWAFCCVNLFSLMPVYCVSFFMPSIIAEFGTGDLASNILSVIPYGVATIAMIFNARHSDQKNERYLHSVIPYMIGCGSFLIMTLVPASAHPALKLFVLSIAAAGVWAGKPSMLTWYSTHLRGSLAFGLAFVFSCGSLGGLIAPVIMGWTRDRTHSYALGMGLISMFLLIATVAATIVYGITTTRDAAEIRKRQSES